MNTPAPNTPAQPRRWLAAATITLAVALAGAGGWFLHDRLAQQPANSARLERQGQRQQPVPKGPVAPGLKLVESFPAPRDPSLSYAAIADQDQGKDQSKNQSKDQAAQLYRTGERVAEIYTLGRVERRYVELDKSGQTFYLFREGRAPATTAEERQQRQQQRMALRTEVIQRRQAARQDAPLLNQQAPSTTP